LEAFGGGVIHYCGNATHHADNFLNTKGLRALNIYNLYNIPSVKKLQDKLQDKIALFVCDFTPVDYQAYFDEMLIPWICAVWRFAPNTPRWLGCLKAVNMTQ
jgi:hypothetical protein